MVNMNNMNKQSNKKIDKPSKEDLKEIVGPYKEYEGLKVPEVLESKIEELLSFFDFHGINYDKYDPNSIFSEEYDLSNRFLYEMIRPSIPPTSIPNALSCRSGEILLLMAIPISYPGFLNPSTPPTRPTKAGILPRQ